MTPQQKLTGSFHMYMSVLQVHEVDHGKQEQQRQLDGLYRTLNRQHSQAKRLRQQLAQVQQGELCPVAPGRPDCIKGSEQCL